jgi:hypothetical protein
MSVGQADRTELRADDRERMQRLSEEVRGRLMEMALITTRTLGIELDRDAVVKFLPVQLSSDDSRDGLALQILERASGPNCMCYIDPPGVCQPCQVDPIKILP